MGLKRQVRGEIEPSAALHRVSEGLSAPPGCRAWWLPTQKTDQSSLLSVDRGATSLYGWMRPSSLWSLQGGDGRRLSRVALCERAASRKKGEQNKGWSAKTWIEPIQEDKGGERGAGGGPEKRCGRGGWKGGRRSPSLSTPSLTPTHPPTHRDLISSRLIMLLFFGPNLFTEEMRNTLTQHRNSLSSVCANTHGGRKTHVWIFTQYTHTHIHTVTHSGLFERLRRR